MMLILKIGVNAMDNQEIMNRAATFINLAARRESLEKNVDSLTLRLQEARDDLFAVKVRQIQLITETKCGEDCEFTEMNNGVLLFGEKPIYCKACGYVKS